MLTMGKSVGTQTYGRMFLVILIIKDNIIMAQGVKARNNIVSTTGMEQKIEKFIPAYQITVKIIRIKYSQLKLPVKTLI